MARLIAGLGNPGPQYAATRHNVGFMVVDALAHKLGFPAWRKGHRGLVTSARRGQDMVILLKPLTYMNLSGLSIQAAATFYKVAPPDILVIYDELDLPLGRLRLREKGGSGGHNGMKSILERLGSEEFPRLRIGISKPPPQWEGKDWVLSTFFPEERPLIEQALQRAVEAIEVYLDRGIKQAMNQYNTVPDGQG